MIIREPLGERPGPVRLLAAIAVLGVVAGLAYFSPATVSASPCPAPGYPEQELALAVDDLALLGVGTAADELEDEPDNDEGLDLLILFGSLLLFVAIITAITAMRRWK